MSLKVLSVAAAFLCCSLSAKADLTGTSVTGSAIFNGTSVNAFDPQYGYVFPGFGNYGGTTVTIGPGLEFGSLDSINFDMANFTGNTLTITDECLQTSCATNYSVQYTFNDAAFSGLAVNFLTNGLGLMASLSGNVLTVSQMASVPSSGTASSVLSFASATTPSATPEPSSLMLLGTGVLGAIGVARRRFAV